MDDSEFAAALAAQVASPEETPTDEPETTEAPEAAVAEDTAEDTLEENIAPDPGPVHPALEKYGDVNKALDALLAAQSKIGEQGSELAEYRRMVEQLVDATAQQQPAPVVGGFDQQIEDNPGQVAQWALQNNQPAVYEQAMEAWFDQNPRQAARFETALQLEAMRAVQEEQIQPQQQAVQEMRQQQAVVAATRSLASRYPDFEEIMATATPDELAGLDSDTVKRLYQDNPAQALELVYRWVAPSRQAVRAAEQQQADTAKAEETRAAKKAASVVTQTTASSREEPSALDRLAEFMLTPEPHDVRNSLTGL